LELLILPIAGIADVEMVVFQKLSSNDKKSAGVGCGVTPTCGDKAGISRFSNGSNDRTRERHFQKENFDFTFHIFAPIFVKFGERPAEM
jgi:hypothetical protein